MSIAPRMDMMSHALREHASGLMSELCRKDDLPPDALRLATHMLVNLGDDAGPRALEAVADALPWLAAFLELQQSESGFDIATRLESRGALRALNSASVAHSIDALAHGATADARRELERLAAIDRDLFALSQASSAEARSILQSDTALLASVVGLVEESGPELDRVTSIFEDWVGPSIHQSARRSESLAVLRDLETTWNGGERLKACALSERSRRFELSSTDHLEEHGFLVSVRAALCFGQKHRGLDDDLDNLRSLRQAIQTFPMLRDDPVARSLAVALARMRFACVEHLRGALPLAALSPWVRFLRGECAEIAESRGISLREATSFAHYSLHIMNFCDFVANEFESVNEQTRKNLMDLENELKEFALVGQQQGLSDLQANLERYDTVRWKGAGEHVVLSERFARLRGVWRLGTDSAPLGGPPRVDGRDLDAVNEALEHLEHEVKGIVGFVSNRIACTHLMHDSVFEELEMHASLRLLAVIAAACEAMPTIDLRPLEEWIRSADHLRFVELALNTFDISRLMDGGALLEGDEGIVATRRDSVLELSFRVRPQTQALFTLLQADPDPTLEKVLRRRLRLTLGGAAPATSLDESTEAYLDSSAASASA